MTDEAAPITTEERRSAAELASEVLDAKDRGPARVDSVDALKKRAIHENVILPSGAIVDIKLPNLPLMIKRGSMPNDLIDAAIQHESLTQDKLESMTREDRVKLLEETWDFVEYIVPLTLHVPQVTREDVADLDPLDIEMITAFAARRTDTDAVGRQLGGLDTQQSFREFRDLISLRAAMGLG